MPSATDLRESWSTKVVDDALNEGRGAEVGGIDVDVDP